MEIYATRADLLDALLDVEANTPIEYMRSGVFSAAEQPVFPSVAAIEGFGIAMCGASMASACYLVFRRDDRPSIRSIALTTGEQRFAVDQVMNPRTVTLRPGGVLDEGCVIAGQLATASPDPSSRALLESITARLRRTFKAVNAYGVGPEALSLLRSGVRLTPNRDGSRVYDLVEE